MLAVTMMGRKVQGNFSVIGYIESFKDEDKILRYIKDKYNLDCRLVYKAIGIRSYNTNDPNIQVIIEIIEKLV